MSILIGYWSNAVVTDTEPRVMRTITDLIRDIRVIRGSNFCIAVHGRHAKTSDESDVLCAGIAAAGAGFASDIWARTSKTALVLGRDIFGRSQIFWTVTDNAVWFSNRLQLLARVVKDPALSLNGFYAYGCFSYVPAPHTPIDNVFAVRAGTELTWQLPQRPPALRNLHQWREAEKQSDETKEALYLRRLLEESVETQLAGCAGEPVGVFLSGGLDSSLTAALLARAGAKIRAYTLDFRAECFSEVAYAELVANTLGIPLTKIPVTAATMRRSLQLAAERLDGLFGDGVTVPLTMLYQRASQEVKTIFNGEGGDQLFAGWTNKPLIAASIYQGTDAFLDSYLRTFHRFQGHETTVYTPALLRLLDADTTLAPVIDALDPSYSRSLLHRLRRANLLLKGADNIQPRATNLGLSYNLDVRTLFCSLPLAEWTFSLSGDLLLRAGCEKYLLKRAVEDLLPAEVLWREKRGMGVPLTLWLSGPLRRWMLRELRSRTLASEGLWQSDLASRILTGELSGHVQGRRIGETLWLLLMWRAWRTLFTLSASPLGSAATPRFSISDLLLPQRRRVRNSNAENMAQ